MAIDFPDYSELLGGAPVPEEQPFTGPPLEELPVFMGGNPEESAVILPEGYEDQVFGDFAGVDWDADDPEYHHANLAHLLEPGERRRLAANIIEWVDRDRQSRRGWEEREAEGIKRLGLCEEDLRQLRKGTQNFEWRSTATHPGLMRACLQFWARAMTEVWQPDGPAKTIVLGDKTPEREEQADRVASFLNYLYLHEMPGAQMEMAQALFRLPLSGSVFRKAWFDPLLGTIRVSFLESQDFVKPYSAIDLSSATRCTHVVRMARNDLNKAIALGYYRYLDLGEPEDESTEHTTLDVAIDSATGVRPLSGAGQHEAEYESRDVLYETSVTLDLNDYGFNDPLGESVEDRRTGERISIGVPYLATVHEGQQDVLSLRRDWRETDARKRRRQNIVEYKYTPGLGGYGFGLLHIAGGLSDAQTGLLRYTLDGCTLDTLGKLSGYVSQSAVGKRGLPAFQIGQFQAVPGTADDWTKQIWTPDFKWSANNALEAIQYLDAQLDQTSASTESMIGDENKNIPVGTILARIEQSSKPFQAIFGLLYDSMTRELRAVAELAADYLPERYPYAVEGADREIFASDFDERLDVVPVADPNVVSSTQRLTQAQVVMEQALGLHTAAGGSLETWQAVIAAWGNLLTVMRVPNREAFIPAMPQPPAPAEQPDPVAADIARKDAAALADIERKDAQAVADVERRTAEMQASRQRQREGDQAVIAQEADAELQRLTRELMRDAEARRAQLAREYGAA